MLENPTFPINPTFPMWTWMILLTLRTIGLTLLLLSAERAFVYGRSRRMFFGILIFTAGYGVALFDGIIPFAQPEPLRVSTLLFNVGVCYLAYLLSIVRRNENARTEDTHVRGSTSRIRKPAQGLRLHK